MICCALAALPNIPGVNQAARTGLDELRAVVVLARSIARYMGPKVHGRVHRPYPGAVLLASLTSSFRLFLFRYHGMKLHPLP